LEEGEGREEEAVMQKGKRMGSVEGEVQFSLFQDLNSKHSQW